jgi:TonB family protein
VRVKQFKSNALNPGSAKDHAKHAPAGILFSFGDTVTLVEREQGYPTMWLVTKGQEKARLPEYLLTTNEAEIDFLRKTDRIPKIISYVYAAGDDTGVRGQFIIDIPPLYFVTMSDGLVGDGLVNIPGGKSPFALKDNAVLFDEAMASKIRTWKNPLVFDVAKRPFRPDSSTMYYCVSGGAKPAFEALDLKALTLLSTAPESGAAPGMASAGAQREGMQPPLANKAKINSRKVTISAGVAAGLLLEKTAPIYPPIAKEAGVSGMVILHVTVSETGAVEDLRVVSGPAMLQQAAMDAVKSWKYQPYLIDGKPVEIETTVNVFFARGN